MPRVPKYTDEQLIEAVKTSVSIRQALIALGLAPKGGNYSTLKKAVSRLGLDTSHFTGQASNRGRKFGFKRPLGDYLENKQPIQSFKLRNRLLKEGVFEHRCLRCRKQTWLGEPIPLELDHINGNSEDNRLENLRMLCPNCHALTPTYRGKNQTRAQ
jgi:hypothetical protein